MSNIVFTRIDDRLIHGQVMTAWVQYTQANEVVIVDNKVAQDMFVQMVMKSAMPNKIELKIFNETDAITYLSKVANEKSKRIFILAKTPLPILNLAKSGISLPQVGIGGMGAREDRSTLYRNISANDEEVNDLIALQELGTDVFVQVITDDNKIALNDAIKERKM